MNIRYSLQLIIMLFVYLASTGRAEDFDGTCATYSFPLRADGSINTTMPVRVLRHRAPIYTDPVSQEIVGHRSFGELLAPTKIAPNTYRILVRAADSPNEAGWMNAKDLLCSIRPLRAKNGLEQKFFIRPRSMTRNDNGTVTAFPFPESYTCENKCRQISKPQRFFIVAEHSESGRYLLGNSWRLDVGEPLIGWVNEADGVLWNTMLGIRPREDVSELLVFTSLEGAAQQQRSSNSHFICLSGGAGWYQYPLRLPLLDRIPYQNREFYKMVIPSVGYRTLSKSDFHLRAEGETNRSSRQLDIFFS